MISNFNLKTLILLRKKNVNPVFCKRNGLIELKTALLGCNTNIEILGSEEQGKNSLFYLLVRDKIKHRNRPQRASLIRHAR
jgi:hypothetical protein